jgi:16S rRNA processing protein RimM
MSAGERLVVGRVRGVHGLRGWVRVESLTDRPQDRFAAGATLFLEGDDRPLTVEEAVAAEAGWRLRFAQVPDRTAAEGLLGAYLEAAPGPDQRLARGEYYWHEVIGAAVTDSDGSALGEVVDVYRAGGAEVAVVAGPSGELDVPLVQAVVRVFQPGQGRIVIDAEAMGLHGDQAGAREAGAREAGGS